MAEWLLSVGMMATLRLVGTVLGKKYIFSLNMHKDRDECRRSFFCACQV